MKKVILLLLIMYLPACSISLKSNQLNAIKRMLNKERHALLDKQWAILFEGKYHEAYAISTGDTYRMYSLEHLEIDFTGRYISEIRIPTPIKYTIKVSKTKGGFTIVYLQKNTVLSLRCQDLQQVSDLIYTQQCESQDKSWAFQNELQVNTQREIVFIKSHYSPSKPPVELYYSQLLNKLKKQVQ